MNFRAYKYRLYPTEDQAQRLNQWFAAVRSVYNAALEQRMIYGRAQGTDPHGRNSGFSQPRQAKDLNFRAQPGRPGLKDDPDLSWLTSTPRECFDAALIDLDKAFDKFFKGQGGFPSFRSKMWNNSFCLKTFNGKRMNVIFGKDSVKLPKIGRVSYKKHKKFYGQPRNVTVTREGDEYYVILVVKQDRKVVPNEDMIGVDLGVSQPVTLSNGEYTLPDEGLLQMEKKGIQLQSKMDRKKKGSKRREKQKRKLAALKRKQARRRAANAHRVTTELTRRFGTIAIEDLKVSNMTASGKHKNGLNRAILNVAPYQFRQQLEYKGSKIIAVNPAYTSQTCNSCGHVSRENRKTQSQFQCVQCGHQDNADVNAAKNILVAAVGHHKAPSEPHKRSATLKGIVSSFEPPENLNSKTDPAGRKTSDAVAPELRVSRSSVTLGQADLSVAVVPELRASHSAQAVTQADVADAVLELRISCSRPTSVFVTHVSSGCPELKVSHSGLD